MIDGLWLNLLLYPKAKNREEAHLDAKTYLARVFPMHFPKPVPPVKASSRSGFDAGSCAK